MKTTIVACDARQVPGLGDGLGAVHPPREAVTRADRRRLRMLACAVAAAGTACGSGGESPGPQPPPPPCAAATGPSSFRLLRLERSAGWITLLVGARPTPVMSRKDAPDGSAVVAGSFGAGATPIRAYVGTVSPSGDVNLSNLSPAVGESVFNAGITATAVNSQGRVVGITSTADFGRPYVGRAGEPVQVIPDPRVESSVNVRSAYDIGESGIVVGEWEVRALVYADPFYADPVSRAPVSVLLSAPQGPGAPPGAAAVYGLNGSRVKVGVAYNFASQRYQAALWSPEGVPRFLPLLPNNSWNPTSRAWAINDAGDVVGYSYTAAVDGNPTVDHAALWHSGGDPIDLGVLPVGGADAFGRRSEALAINDSGSVVGWSACASRGGECAFLWTRAEGMRDLDQLIDADARAAGWRLIKATGISNGGYIVAQAYPPGQTLFEDVILLPVCSGGGG